MRKKIVSISLILSCFAVCSLSAQEAGGSVASDETVQVDGIESAPGVNSHDGCGCGGTGKPK